MLGKRIAYAIQYLLKKRNVTAYSKIIDIPTGYPEISMKIKLGIHLYLFASI